MKDKKIIMDGRDLMKRREVKEKMYKLAENKRRKKISLLKKKMELKSILDDYYSNKNEPEVITVLDSDHISSLLSAADNILDAKPTTSTQVGENTFEIEAEQQNSKNSSINLRISKYFQNDQNNPLEETSECGNPLLTQLPSKISLRRKWGMGEVDDENKDTPFLNPEGEDLDDDDMFLLSFSDNDDENETCSMKEKNCHSLEEDLMKMSIRLDPKESQISSSFSVKYASESKLSPIKEQEFTGVHKPDVNMKDSGTVDKNESEKTKVDSVEDAPTSILEKENKKSEENYDKINPVESSADSVGENDGTKNQASLLVQAASNPQELSPQKPPIIPLLNLNSTSTSVLDFPFSLRSNTSDNSLTQRLATNALLSMQSSFYQASDLFNLLCNSEPESLQQNTSDNSKDKQLSDSRSSVSMLSVPLLESFHVAFTTLREQLDSLISTTSLLRSTRNLDAGVQISDLSINSTISSSTNDHLAIPLYVPPPISTSQNSQINNPLNLHIPP
jgi:hypothetical protein